MVQEQMGFIVLWSLEWVTWVGSSSSPAELGSEQCLAVSTSPAEPAKEATQWAVSTGCPKGPKAGVPASPGLQRAASGEAQGKRADSIPADFPAQGLSLQNIPGAQSWARLRG